MLLFKAFLLLIVSDHAFSEKRMEREICMIEKSSFIVILNPYECQTLCPGDSFIISESYKESFTSRCVCYVSLYLRHLLNVGALRVARDDGR